MVNINISNVVNGNLSKQEIHLVIQKSEIDTSFYDFKFFNDIKIDGLFKYTNGLYELSINLKTIIELNCDRCVESFNMPIEINILEKFSKTKSNLDDVLVLQSQKLELEEIINNNILLLLPIKRLCSCNCKGICSICGKNLNNDVCSCKSSEY